MVRVFGFLIKSSISFRLQQVFFSYGLLLGVGVGCVVDTATLMVGQVGFVFLFEGFVFVFVGFVFVFEGFVFVLHCILSNTFSLQHVSN